ncbi:MAG TPA: energy transducer TonB [Terracidiphilus sp.]|jgi:TonB family protein|nr:energy transducer TonB [Terracidiphilus sp.]
MSNRAASNPEIVTRGRLAVERSNVRPRAETAYNRSSLAVDYAEPEVEPMQPLPRLIPMPAGSAAVMRVAPSFVGLDIATRQRDPAAKVISAIIHGVAIAGILWLGFQVRQATVAPVVTAPVEITLYAPPPPPKILPVAPKQGGGGGGGAHQVIEPTRGNPPRVVAPAPVNAPQILRLDHPKLAAEPAEIVKMPENPALPNLGLSNSPQIALASQGKGSNSGFGSGSGGGLGMGHGIGAGPGSGGGYGGGVMSVGGGVSAPVVIRSVQPEFTEDARQANFQGSASLELIVDQQGNPQNIRIVRRLGMGLDEKAVEAARQYKFRPAMFQGHPVAVQIIVDVDFHLH